MDAASSARALQALERASRLLQAGQGPEALAITGRVIVQAPRSAGALHVHALALASCGHHEAADRWFREALACAPGDAAILLNHAAALRMQGRLGDAVGQLQRLVTAHPSHAQGWTELGRTLLRMTRAKEAARALERAVGLDPRSAQAWHLLGNARRDAGHLDRAEDAFRRCIEHAPAQWTAWINLGAVLRMAGRPDESVEIYTHVARNGYFRPELLDAWAGALLDTGDVRGAIAMAERLTREYPAYAAGHVTRAHLLWEYGGSEELSIDVLREVAHRQPGQVELHAALVRWLLASGAHGDALDEIRILRSRVAEPECIALEAEVLDASGLHAEAGRLYASLHAGWGAARPAFLRAYARHLLRTHDPQRAAVVAESALHRNRADQEAWAYLGTAWRLLEDPREEWLCDTQGLVGILDIGFPGGSAGEEDVRRVLDGLHLARRAPRQQSVRGGTQTAGRLLQRSDPVLAAMRAHLLAAVEGWLAGLPRDDAHPFLARNRGRVALGGSWSVRLASDGAHADHVHQEGWISSAFYVALPPSVADSDSQAGCLRFGCPPASLGLDLPPRRIVRPEAGRLVLFPSYFWHGTEPFSDVAPRLTIAFDMTPVSHGAPSGPDLPGADA